MQNLKLGIQLYTVRTVLNDDFKGALAKLAEMGYQGVEFAWNYGGMNPEELAAFLKETGLECCGFHSALPKLLEKDHEDYQYAKAVGSKYITTSLAGEVAKDWMGTINQVNQMAKIAKDNGFIFTYHNHAQEFEKIDGEYALDIFYAKTDPEYVQAELDTHWIKRGGAEVIPYLKKYADRLPQIHVKDIDSDDNFVEIGTGLIDFSEVIKVGREANAEWLIYEQDTCPGDPLESAKKSIDHLKSLLS